MARMARDSVNSFKNDEKYFLFHGKSSFHFQDIKFLSVIFGYVEKIVLLER